VKLTTLKKRSEFLRIRGGTRCPTPPFVLETKPRLESAAACAPPRFGFTVTKAMGGAVERNRIRRRLKAAVTAIAATAAQPGRDYVLIARKNALDIPFDALKKDLERAFHRVHHAPATKPRARRSGAAARE
jgi:ribonuclease P protein component